MTTQLLTYDSVVGPRTIEAPPGDYDKTATLVWVWLMSVTLEQLALSNTRHTKQALMLLEAKREAYSLILGNSVGMASFYWMQESHRFATRQKSQDNSYSMGGLR